MSVARFIADQKTFWRVPVAMCCALLGVSVSWFYKWWPRAQVGGPSTKRARRRGEDRVRRGSGVARLAAADR